MGQLVAIALATIAAAALVAPSVATASFPGANGRITYGLGDLDLSDGFPAPAPGPYATDQSGTITLPAGADATWSSDGRRLLLVEAGGIVSILPDGSDRRVVTTNPADEDPAWSPDGRSAAFERDEEIWIAGLAGGGERMLRAGRDPAWSPDGRLLAFVTPFGDAEGPGDVAVVQPDGAGFRQLTDAPDMGTDADPDWSPDGSRIAFWRVESRHPGHVGVVDVATGADDLFDAPETDDARAADRTPAWAPDGSRVLFTRTWTTWTFGPNPGCCWQSPDRLVSVNPAGTDPQPVATAADGARYDDLAWQPINRPPTASIAVDEPSPLIGRRVRFTATAGDPDGPLTGLAWDLDDDGAFDDGEGPVADFAFVAAGDHVVRLEVRDNQHERHVFPTTVTARSPAAAPGPPGGPGGGALVDTTAPGARLAVERRRLPTALRRGLLVRLELTEPAAVVARAAISRSLARRLRIPTIVATGRSATIKGGPRRVRLRFAGRVRRRLSRLRSVRMSIRVELVDRAGNRGVQRLAIRLTR